MKVLANVVISAILIFFVSGCSDSHNATSPATQNPSVRGVVMTDGENGGVMRVLSKSGTIIGEESVYKLGGFQMKADGDLPGEFLIEVDLRFDEIDCTYSYEAAGPEPDKIFYVGPISTLIHKYHVKHPEKSLNAIREEVLLFFGIDPNHSNYRINCIKALFSVKNFMDQAFNYGGFDLYINYLLDELSSGKGPYCFGVVTEDPEASLFESLMSDLNENLESAAMDYATGWVLDMIGGGNGDNPQVDIEALLAQELQMLNQIEAQITELEKELKAAVAEIEDKIDQSTYNTAVTVIASQVGEIEAKYEQLSYYATLQPDKKNEEDIANLGIQIKDSIPVAFQTIKDVIHGNAGSEGLFSLWSRIAFKNVSNVADYVPVISNQFSYYFGLQLKAINLMVEVYHAEDPANIQMATTYFRNWINNLRDELDLFNSFNPVSELATSTEFPVVNTVGGLYAWPTISSTLSWGNKVIVTDGGWYYKPTEDPNIRIFSIDSETLQERFEYTLFNEAYRATAVDGTYLYVLYHLENDNYRLYQTPMSGSEENWTHSDFTLTYGCLKMMVDEHGIFILGGNEDDGFYLNIRNQATLDHVKTVQVGGSSGGTLASVSMALEGDYAYILTQTEKKLSSFNLNSLEIEGTLVLNGPVSDFSNMVARDNTLCISSDYFDVWLVDISDKSDLKITQTVNFQPDDDPHKYNDFYPVNVNFAGNFIYVVGFEVWGDSTMYVVYNNPYNLDGPLIRKNMVGLSYLMNWEPVLMDGENAFYLASDSNTLQLWKKHVVVDIPLY